MNVIGIPVGYGSGTAGWLFEFNTFIWVVSNIAVLLIFIAASLFSIGYPVLFKISTTGGWRMWRAILSLAGFGFLSVLGVFVDPQTAQWWQLPPGVDWWRPFVRLVIFVLIAVAFISLTTYLMQRRFFPKRLVVPPEVAVLLASDLVIYGGTGTGSIDTKKVAEALVKAGWTKPGLIDPLPNTLGVIPRTLPPTRRRR